MNAMTKYDLGGSAILSGAVIVGLVYAVSWYMKPAPVPHGITVIATPAPEVANEEKTEVTVKQPVKVYKPAIKTKLKLPESITQDDGQHVIASSKTANDERQHTVTTVINQNTGEVQTFDRTEPLTWLSVNTKSEIGVYYGMKSGEPTVRIEGRQELLQIKAVHVGAIASADMVRGNTDGFVGVGAWARW